MVYLQMRYIFLRFLLYQEEKLGVYGTEKLYNGCYLDQIERTLPYGKLDDNAMTNDKCASHCCSILDDATFSGTQAMTQCFCSNVTNTYHFVQTYPRNCDMPCSGNSIDICGGAWKISVYRIYCSTTTFMATPKQGLITTSEIFTTTKSTIGEKSTMMSTNLPFTSHISTLITELTSETTKPASLESILVPLITTTDTPQLDLHAWVGSNYSVCSCADCLPLNNTIWTEEEIANKVTLLKNAISINKKETNLFKNTKRSAYDSRKSARNLGIVGIIVMMFPIICVVVIDILSIFTVNKPVAVFQNGGL